MDDHPLLREGLAAVIATQSDMRLIAEASDGKEALALFEQHRPDVTLMDLQMPNMDGIETITAIRKNWPSARIVVLTTYELDEYGELGPLSDKAAQRLRDVGHASAASFSVLRKSIGRPTVRVSLMSSLKERKLESASTPRLSKNL